MSVAFSAVGPSSSGAASGTSPLTWTHVCGASDTELLVGVGHDNTTVGSGGLAVTYNGVSLGSPVLTWPSGGAGQTVGYVALFAMASPPSGSHTVSVSFTAGDDVEGGSLSYTGSASLGTAVHSDSGGVNATSGTVTVTGTTSGNLVYAIVTAGSGGISFTSGTQRYSVTAGGSGAATGTGAADKAAGGSVSITWTQTSDFYGAIGVEIQAGGATVSNPPQAARRAAYRTPALPPVRRYRSMLPVPRQLNPPYPFTEITQRRQTWPREMPHRGHVTFVVPKQVNPPYLFTEISQHRDTWPKTWPHRGRIVTPVPPQVNPPYPFAEVRQWRQPRGFFSRRGHGFIPVPAQQAATPNPAITFEQAKHLRMVYLRRGHVFTPVPGQHHPVPELTQHRVQPKALPRRGRLAQPVAAQVTVANPAWVQGHRAPARAIALIRRRWHDLFPWPQATAPAFSIGALTATDKGLAALTGTQTASSLTATGSSGTLTATDQRTGGPA